MTSMSVSYGQPPMTMTWRLQGSEAVAAALRLCSVWPPRSCSSTWPGRYSKVMILLSWRHHPWVSLRRGGMGVSLWRRRSSNMRTGLCRLDSSSAMRDERVVDCLQLVCRLCSKHSRCCHVHQILCPVAKSWCMGMAGEREVRILSPASGANVADRASRSIAAAASHNCLSIPSELKARASRGAAAKVPRS